MQETWLQEQPFRHPSWCLRAKHAESEHRIYERIVNATVRIGCETDLFMALEEHAQNIEKGYRQV